MCVVSLPAGRFQHLPPVGWETLCNDVRLVILNKLALKDLARAAKTCREYQKAYHSKLAQERADCIADARGSFLGFDGLVTVLQRSLRGHHPFPFMPDVPDGVKDAGYNFYSGQEILLSRSEGPQYVTPHKAHLIWEAAMYRQDHVEACALIGKETACALLGDLAIEPRLRPNSISLVNYAKKGEKWEVAFDEGPLVATVGFLVAIFTENPTTQLGTFPKYFANEVGYPEMVRWCGRLGCFHEADGGLGCYSEAVSQVHHNFPQGVAN